MRSNHTMARPLHFPSVVFDMDRSEGATCQIEQFNDATRHGRWEMKYDLIGKRDVVIFCKPEVCATGLGRDRHIGIGLPQTGQGGWCRTAFVRLPPELII